MSKVFGTQLRIDGKRRDTAVQPLAEELAALFASEAPLEINGPLVINNKSNGPAIVINNQGSVDQTAGVRVTDEAGRVSQMGIGLGSIGLLANEYIPLQMYSINAQSAQNFYRDGDVYTFGALSQAGMPTPEPGPGSEAQQVDPGFKYSPGGGPMGGAGGNIGGGGGTTGGNTNPGLGISFVFGFPITVVNHRIITFNTYIIGGAGLSDTFSVVTDVTCNAGTLSVTYEDLTFGAGVLKDRS